MKHFILVVILVSLLCCFSFAAGDRGGLTLNTGISMFFEEDSTPAERAAEALFLSAIVVGGGYHFNIIPHILAPGFYADLHLSFISLLKDEDDIHDLSSAKNKTSFFQLGGRIYNQFRLGPIDIQPFFGLNLMVGGDDTYGLKMFGILVAFKMVGFEYSYQNPITKPMDTNVIHRFALLFHYRPK